MRFALLASASLVLSAVPAGAAVTVIGPSAAQLCYDAARAEAVREPGAFAACDRALALEPLSERDRVATHVNRGILKVRMGEIGAGIADFDAAIALDPNEPEAYLNRGVALLRRQDASAALPFFTAALERNTSEPALAHYGRAVANEALGHSRLAYEDYRRAAELEPTWAQPRADLARFAVRPR